jgi:hypothetical protein
MFKDIENLIERYTAETEANLNIAELTIAHGLHSFRYGSSEFLSMIFSNSGLHNSSVFYDLGSGYGKVLLYGAVNFPNSTFKGIEILPERNKVCLEMIEKFRLTNVQVSCTDILTADLIDGDVFYIYNSLFDFQYGQLLDKLKAIANTKPIKIIAESRVAVFDNQDWLNVYHTHDLDILRKIKFYISE